MNAAVVLVEKLEARGAVLTVTADGLAIDAPEGTLTAGWLTSLKKYKKEIVELLADRDRPPWWTDDLTAAENLVVDQFMGYGPDGEVDGWETALADVAPCDRCGSLWCWWDLWGDQHCRTCDPPIKAVLAVEKARRLRQGAMPCC